MHKKQGKEPVFGGSDGNFSDKMEKTIDKIDKYNTIHKKTVELLLIYIKIKLSIDFFNESG